MPVEHEVLIIKTGQIFDHPIEDVSILLNAAGLFGWNVIGFAVPSTVAGIPTHTFWVLTRNSDHPLYEGPTKRNKPGGTPLVAHYPDPFTEAVIRWYKQKMEAPV